MTDDAHRKLADEMREVATLYETWKPGTYAPLIDYARNWADRVEELGGPFCKCMVCGTQVEYSWWCPQGAKDKTHTVGGGGTSYSDKDVLDYVKGDGADE